MENRIQPRTILAASVDLACVVIQRYNRPRLVKLLERKSA